MYTENLKLACYAGSGVGKTVGIGQLVARFGKEHVHVLSCEKGLNTIKSKLEPEMVTECEDLDDFQQAVENVKKRNLTEQDWVCIDGGSRVLQWLMQDTFDKATAVMYDKSLAQDPTYKQYAGYVTKEGVLDTRRLYTKLADRADRMSSKFVRLPCSIYFTFWENRMWQDAYTQSQKYDIDAPGDGTRTAVKGALDYIYRLKRENDKLVSYHREGPLQYAKNRDERDAGVRVPEKIEEFNLADFVERVRGKGFGEK